MSRPELRVIDGGGDIVAYCEDLLEQARAGNFEALAVASVGSGDCLGIGYACRDDLPRKWSMLVASVASLQHALLIGDIDP